MPVGPVLTASLCKVCGSMVASQTSPAEFAQANSGLTYRFIPFWPLVGPHPAYNVSVAGSNAAAPGALHSSRVRLAFAPKALLGNFRLLLKMCTVLLPLSTTYTSPLLLSIATPSGRIRIFDVVPGAGYVADTVQALDEELLQKLDGELKVYLIRDLPMVFTTNRLLFWSKARRVGPFRSPVWHLSRYTCNCVRPGT